jgi:hypothetical protein
MSTTRQSISLAEAYMAGTFTKVDQNTLRYPDYIDDTIWYSDSIIDVNGILKTSYSTTTRLIQSWSPLPIQVTLHDKSKEVKIQSLKDLDDDGKAQLECIRLYDFIKGINIKLPNDVMDRMKDKVQYQEFLNSDDGKLLHDEIEGIKTHRLALGTALRLSNIDDLMEGYQKPLYVTGTRFVSLDSQIARSIGAIDKDEIEELLDNQSRAHAECCIC